MACFGNNLTRAKEAARANADSFNCTYYVVSTTAGLYVERERPTNADLIAWVAVPSWYVGKELFDLHYGWGPVREACDIGAGVVEWRRADGMPPLSAYLQAVAHGVHRTYTNKMLMLIAGPDDEGWWTAGWSYDGMRAGVCKIKPKVQP